MDETRPMSNPQRRYAEIENYPKLDETKRTEMQPETTKVVLLGRVKQIKDRHYKVRRNLIFIIIFVNK